MSMRMYALRRVALAAVTAYLLLTLTFGIAVITGDPGLAALKHNMARGGASEAEIREAVAEYEEAHNLDESIPERYVGYLVSMTTLDWGRSVDTGRPVAGTVIGALRTTFTYVIPAAALSIVCGIGTGLYTATNRGSIAERLGNVLGYAGLGLPSFWVAAVLEILFLVPLYREAFVQVGPPAPGTVARIEQLRLLFATLALTVTLFAGQLRYARAEVREYAGTPFIKAVRAKGAGSLRVARHILRNAAIPFVSLFFTDLLAVLVVNVFVVEAVLSIPGIGALSLQAIQGRDTPVIIGATMAIVFIGIAGNLVQDLTQTALDPRIDHEN